MAAPPVLKTYNSAEGIQPLGDLWTLQRGAKRLRCALNTHPLGWELRARQGNAAIPSQVCKTQDEVFDVSAAWREAAIGAGWAEEP